jgi:hypothetical protein
MLFAYSMSITFFKDYLNKNEKYHFFSNYCNLTSFMIITIQKTPLIMRSDIYFEDANYFDLGV